MFNKIILIIGPKRAGKTRKVSELVRNLDRSVTFDLMKDRQYTSEDDSITVIRGKPREFAMSIGHDKEKFNVVYQPVIINLKDNGLIDAPEFEPLLKLCHLRGNMYFVIDEAHLLCNSRNCPAELVMASYVGGHSGFSLILVAQSFSGIHPIIRRNADEFYFWKIIEPSDLDGIKERCGVEVREQVYNLRSTETDDNNQFKSAGQMLHWTKSRGVVEVTK
jgi:hypothetical protein